MLAMKGPHTPKLTKAPAIPTQAPYSCSISHIPISSCRVPYCLESWVQAASARNSIATMTWELTPSQLGLHRHRQWDNGAECQTHLLVPPMHQIHTGSLIKQNLCVTDHAQVSHAQVLQPPAAELTSVAKVTQYKCLQGLVNDQPGFHRTYEVLSIN